MKQNHLQQVQWLLDNESFRKWVYQPDALLLQEWRQWQQEHPGWQEAVVHARHMLLDIQGDGPDLSDEYVDDRVRHLLERLAVNPPAARPFGDFFAPSRWWWVAAAGLLPVLLSLGWWWSRRGEGGASAPPTSQTKARTSVADPAYEWIHSGEQPRNIRLADNSMVRLGANSRLGYLRTFSGQRRDVYLAGEAFFSILHDPKRPFWVHAPGLNTEVLGTSFSIKAYEGATQASVTVRTGRVSVYATPAPGSDAAKPSVVLTPNQRVVLSTTDYRLTRSLVEQPQPVVPPTQVRAFVFQRTPLPLVLNVLEDTYGIKIRYDERVLRSCTLTATLGKESLWEKLRWICAGTGSSYKIVDGEILLSSPGCPPSHSP